MTDYAEMRRALRRLNERLGTLEGRPCPKGCCFGTLRREDDAVSCDRCGDGAGHTERRGPFDWPVRRLPEW